MSWLAWRISMYLKQEENENGSWWPLRNLSLVLKNGGPRPNFCNFFDHVSHLKSRKLAILKASARQLHMLSIQFINALSSKWQPNITNKSGGQIGKKAKQIKESKCFLFVIIICRVRRRIKLESFNCWEKWRNKQISGRDGTFEWTEAGLCLIFWPDARYEMKIIIHDANAHRKNNKQSKGWTHIETYIVVTFHYLSRGWTVKWRFVA